MSKLTFVLAALIATNTVADAPPIERTLFTFNDPESVKQWQTVNDGVMGGRSDGRVRINEFKNLEFFGTLSLANNGGFASVRSRATALNLRADDLIVLKLRGDGRDYTLNLYTPTRRMAFSYRAAFSTKKGEWVEVAVPLSKFVATSFGRVVSQTPVDAGQVSGIGIMLGDKKPGDFKLEIDSISVRSPKA